VNFSKYPHIYIKFSVLILPQINLTVSVTLPGLGRACHERLQHVLTTRELAEIQGMAAQMSAFQRHTRGSTSHARRSFTGSTAAASAQRPTAS
jgi:hypothetical protein